MLWHRRIGGAAARSKSWGSGSRYPNRYGRRRPSLERASVVQNT